MLYFFLPKTPDMLACPVAPISLERHKGAIISPAVFRLLTCVRGSKDTPGQNRIDPDPLSNRSAWK